MSSLKNHKRIHFIVPYPFNIAPGQRFRYEQYLSILEEKRFQITIYPFLSERTNQILYTKGNLLKKAAGVFAGYLKRFCYLPFHIKADFVFVFREATPLGPPVIEWILAKVLRKKIIYDFDDAIWLTDKIQESKLERIIRNRSKVSKICKWSYKVACGNEYLLNYAKHFNPKVILNPTTIDTEQRHNRALYKNKVSTDYITIGWTGSHSTLKYLDQLVPVIQYLEQKYNIHFLVIANKKPNLNLKSLTFLKWSVSTEIEDLMQIDIGVMPLSNDKWAAGKCGFKALQYMALEIPTLVSPVGVNKKIIQNEINGMYCNSQEDWVTNLELLITNADLKKKLGTAGRISVTNSYSVLSNSDNFVSLFS